MSVKYKLEMILASLIDESPVVNICAIFDNINRLKHTVYYILLTECICVSYDTHKKKAYFPKHHQPDWSL